MRSLCWLLLLLSALSLPPQRVLNRAMGYDPMDSEDWRTVRSSRECHVMEHHINLHLNLEDDDEDAPCRTDHPSIMQYDSLPAGRNGCMGLDGVRVLNARLQRLAIP